MTGRRPPAKGGKVDVMCWCGRKMVKVDAADVGDTTAPCGRRDCGPPPGFHVRKTC